MFEVQQQIQDPFVVAAEQQSKLGEVTVPVVDLLKPPPGHDVAVGQGHF